MTLASHPRSGKLGIKHGIKMTVNEVEDVCYRHSRLVASRRCHGVIDINDMDDSCIGVGVLMRGRIA